MAKCGICPMKKHCRDAGNGENCAYGEAFNKLVRKIARLRSKNKELMALNDQLRRDVAELESRINIITNPNF